MDLLNLLFPKRCVGCRSFGSYFCKKCIQNIKQTDLVCPKCERLAVGGQTHPVCRRKYGLDGLWSLGIYQDPLRLAIKKLKYRFVRDFAEVLVDIMIEYWAFYQPFLLDEIKKDQGKSWLVVPVPLHPKRERWRGFNQSAILGKILALKLGIKYSESLVRIKETKPQAYLKGKERYSNIRGAFAVSSSLRAPTGSPGRGNLDNVILIDDVWTTGSTLKECTFMLKRNGAKKVWAITIAR